MPDPGTLPPPPGRFGPDRYATWRRSSLGEITERLEQRLLLRLAGPMRGQAALDVGCGDGTLLRRLADHGAGPALGCDPDPRMVARATAAGLAATVARAQALPFPDARFDLVTCVTVLAFLPDAADAVREMARVLRPGGRLVIGDLGQWSLWAARRRLRGWLGAQLWRAARFRTMGQLVALATEAGLAVRQSEAAIFFPPWPPLARLMAPADPLLGRLTTVGAAFLAIQATKPPAPAGPARSRQD